MAPASPGNGPTHEAAEGAVFSDRIFASDADETADPDPAEVMESAVGLPPWLGAQLKPPPVGVEVSDPVARAGSDLPGPDAMWIGAAVLSASGDGSGGTSPPEDMTGPAIEARSGPTVLAGFLAAVPGARHEAPDDGGSFLPRVAGVPDPLPVEPAEALPRLTTRDLAEAASGPGISASAQGLVAQMTSAAPALGHEAPSRAEGLRLWQGTFLEDRGLDVPVTPAATDGADRSRSGLPLPNDNSAAAIPHLVTGSDLPGLAAGLEVSAEALFPADFEPVAASQVSGGTGSLQSGQGPTAAAGQPPVSHFAARLVDSLLTTRNGVTEFALSPEELGQVRVTLQTDGQNADRMIVLLSFDRPETLDLFRRHADQLAEALRAAGYSGVDIGFGQSGAGADHGEDAPPDGLAAESHAEHKSADPAAQDIAIRPMPVAAGGSLDLRL